MVSKIEVGKNYILGNSYVLRDEAGGYLLRYNITTSFLVIDLSKHTLVNNGKGKIKILTQLGDVGWIYSFYQIEMTELSEE